MPGENGWEMAEFVRRSTSTEQRCHSHNDGPARQRELKKGVSVEQAAAEFADLERQLSRRGGKKRMNVDVDVDVEKATVDDGESDDSAVSDLETTLRCGLDAGSRAKHIGVCWDGLTVRGVASTANYVQTLPYALMRLFDVATPVLRLAGLCGKPAESTLLHGISGVCRPGEMVLVLGKPGAGCSTLLRTVANQRRGYTAVEGEVRYGPWSATDFGRRFRGEAVYNAEDDAHLATLTVEQTLGFALDLAMPTATTDTRRRVLDTLLRMFNMEHARATAVGDAYVRGLSGGERRRVSIAEMMLTRACVLCWDNSTRGLDASTALDFVRSLRVQTDLYQTATLVSLYQASESIYRLFDRVLVLAEGRQVYFGSAVDARAYFEGLGFAPSPRQTTADYLVACADGRLGPDALSDAFGLSEAAARLDDDLAAYRAADYADEGRRPAFRAAVRGAQRGAAARSAYRAGFRLQLCALARRQFALKLQDRFNLVLSWVRSIIIALVLGTLFRNLDRTSASAFGRGGLLFVSLFFNALQAFSELGSTMLGRAVVDKHGAYAFHRPSALWIAQLAVDQAFAATEILAFSIIVYLMTGLVRDAGAFFTFYLLMLSGNVAMTLVFRIIGCLSRDFDRAIRIAIVVITLFVTTSGYIVQYEAEKPWLRWMLWVNVLGLIFGALMENEFGRIDLVCAADSLIPSGPGYDDIRHQVCTLPGSRPGTLDVRGSDYIAQAFSFRNGDLWRNWAIVVVIIVAFLLLNVVAGELMRFNGGGGGGGSARVSLRPSRKRRALNEQLATARRDNEKDGGADSPKMLPPAMQPESVLAWEGLTYDVPTAGGGTRRLLAGIDGFVRAGELTALMGASGAGKTTLLDVLAARKTVGVVGGSVVGHQQREGQQRGGRATAYAEQLDVHEPTQTVREALRFSADLRQPQGTSREERQAYVEQVLVMLEMEPLADCLVGTGLSVEERKRVTIGVELAARPEVLLFLDEPTSGLDSQGALNTIRLLRKLAAAGQAILCTVHQPDAALFALFDRLLLMQRGGRVVYFGDVGPDAVAVRAYFARYGAEAAPTDNVAEFMLEAIGAGGGEGSSQAGRRCRRRRRRDWADLWEGSPERAVVAEVVARMGSPERAVVAEVVARMVRRGGGGDGDGVVPVSFHPGGGTRTMATTTTTTTTTTHQLRIVTVRACRALWRSPDYVVTRLFGQVAVALATGLTYLGLDDSRASLQNTVFIMFQVTVVPALVMSQVGVLFQARRAVFFRERAAGMYSPAVFAAAMAAAEVPISLLCGCLFFICLYLAPRLSLAPSRAGYQLLMILATEMFASTLGQAMASLTPSARIMAQLDPLLITVLALFCGVAIPASQMPSFFRSWLLPLDPLSRLISGMVTTALAGLPVRCRPGELNRFSAPETLTCRSYMDGFFAKGGAGYLVSGDGVSCEYCAYKVGDEFFGPLAMSFEDRWRDLGIFAAFIVSNLAIIFLASRFLNFGRR
ncbi:hypothetical protein L249_2588 [Ophiocordyceps polyrhachis-furcata BCC 54312]|uniref:ABC transporter domain-containing protein n=1 Tax=Ophiocordyceps polyrhachis-furcata BCC 54312 TaxID=1330021 RepID=A0A367LP86_9HYPO|nr:hypothetical protein L249_2588 [Ophiocordyceps polyrhachis-furcata BCC 54312]